ncbi:MAG: DUF2087 domain-containing protein [Clostridia bacterium]|nr:DUF2087 domain-containing protein [Clostridia bacterium]MDD4048395.1 DUF2087 domain-containing protein [Clostridia bacterium]
MRKKIDNFLDENGKLKQLPAKYTIKLLAYDYLASKFENHVEYTEQEVNAIISSWHTFGDYFTLRRGLVDSGWLMRLMDGSKYWKNKEKRKKE